jgi:hypothetical protein
MGTGSSGAPRERLHKRFCFGHFADMVPTARRRLLPVGFSERPAAAVHVCKRVHRQGLEFQVFEGSRARGPERVRACLLHVRHTEIRRTQDTYALQL